MWVALVVAIAVGGVLINALNKEVKRLEALVDKQGLELRHAIQQLEGNSLQPADRKALDAVHHQLMLTRLGEIVGEATAEGRT